MSDPDPFGLAEEALVDLLVVAEARPRELRSRPIMVVGAMIGPEKQVTLITHRKWLEQFEETCARSIVRLSHPALATCASSHATSLRALTEVFREIRRTAHELQPSTPGAVVDSPTAVDSSSVKRNIEKIVARAKIALEDLHLRREQPQRTEKHGQSLPKRPATVPSRATDARTVAHAAEVEAYVFRKVGDTWEVTFEGEHATGLKDLSGMRHLRALLAQPNPSGPTPALNFKEIPWSQGVDRLSNEERATVAEGDSHQEVLDPEALKQYRNRLRELEGEIQEARDRLDERQQARLESEKEKIVEEIKASTGKLGSSRRIGRSPSERATQAVEKAIRRARDHLREKELHTLADHLENSIKREGTGFAYRPGPEPPAWSL